MATKKTTSVTEFPEEFNDAVIAMTVSAIQVWESMDKKERANFNDNLAEYLGVQILSLAKEIAEEGMKGNL